MHVRRDATCAIRSGKGLSFRPAQDYPTARFMYNNDVYSDLDRSVVFSEKTDKVYSKGARKKM